jgi:hypothetical protein
MSARWRHACMGFRERREMEAQSTSRPCHGQ